MIHYSTLPVLFIMPILEKTLNKGGLHEYTGAIDSSVIKSSLILLIVLRDV